MPKWDGWMGKHGTSSTAIERFETKQEALEWGRDWMKKNGHPAMVVTDSNHRVQYITLNSQRLKEPHWWKQQGLLSL